MRKLVLYYAAFFKAPEYKEAAYVIAQYNNGSVRYWYPNQRGFKSALRRALKSNGWLMSDGAVW